MQKPNDNSSPRLWCRPWLWLRSPFPYFGVSRNEIQGPCDFFLGDSVIGGPLSLVLSGAEGMSGSTDHVLGPESCV